MKDHTIPAAQIEAAIKALVALDGRDPEADHGKADDIMAGLLPESVRVAVDDAELRADGWWWA